MEKKLLTGAFNFAATFQHALAKRCLIEMVPTSWVMAKANPEIKEESDLTPGGQIVSLGALWDDMVRQGMRDPFILSAGRTNGDCRLEAGNHRVALFARAKINFIPATVLVADDCVIFPANGPHRYQRNLLLPVGPALNGPYDERIYMAPSNVFQDIRALKESGVLPIFSPT